MELKMQKFNALKKLGLCTNKEYNEKQIITISNYKEILNYGK